MTLESVNEKLSEIFPQELTRELEIEPIIENGPLLIVIL